ncbi:MAG: hypothetical protein ACPGLV_04500 [Bacteroidia bacterium]
MREDLHKIERIERYIEGQMDQNEREEFEKEMDQNPQLKKDTEFFRTLKDGISRQAIKLDIKKAQYRYVKKTKKGAKIRKFLFGGGSFLIMVVAIMLIVLPEEKREESIFGKIFNKVDNEIIKSHPEDPFKDYLPESEFFTINNSADTTITSADGVKLYLPKGSLKLPNGSTPTEPITIEIADANNASESMLGNLVSDDDLLVEDAVFVNAKSGDQQLVPDKETPPYMEIPTAVTLPNKKVYSGTKAKDGSIKWNNPQLPQNYLVPYKYKYLDYYPDSFKATVNSNLPYKGREVANKKLLDSLFFNTPLLTQEISIIGDPNDPSIMVDRKILEKYANCDSSSCGICPSYIQAFTNKKYERSLLSTREFMDRLNIIYKTCDKELLNIYINNTDKQLWEIDEMAYAYLSNNKKAKGSKAGSGSADENRVEKAGIIAFFSDGKLLAQDMTIKTEASTDSVSDRYDYAQYFKEFAKQKLTNVANSHIYAALIAKEYEKDLKAVLKEQMQIEKTYKQEIREDIKARTAHTKRVEKYKKLTSKRVKSRMKAYGFKVESMGWKAIAEIKTLPAIIPEPLYVNIDNYEQYDHYHTYFAVTDLGVIGKLNRNGDGQFIMNEHRIINLPRNNTSQITLVAVGFKGKEIHLAQMPYSTEKSGTATLSLELKPTDEAKKILDGLSGRSKKFSLWYDMEQQQAFYAEMVRRQKLAKEEAFRRKLHNIIYPCCALSTVRPNAGYSDSEVILEEFDNTMWEYREGIKVIHKDGKVEYIFKDKDPVRFKKYYKMGDGKAEVILPD